MSKFKQDIIAKAVADLSDLKAIKPVCHQQQEESPMPSVEVLEEVVMLVRSVIFPGFFGNSSVNSKTIKRHIKRSIEKLAERLTQQILAGLCFDKEQAYDKNSCVKQAQSITESFISRLSLIRQALTSDVMAAYNGDPAAKNYGEIIFCYPAIRAISNYRIAHELLLLGVPLIPRIITEMAHSETGIDIHPGAKIGHFFTIDHGTGVVIGETAIIGNNVKLYQGVTLGAKSFPLDEHGNPIKGIDRHPILEDDVIVYSNATILGRITIGKGSVIGGNVWVDTDVAANSKVLQKK